MTYAREYFTKEPLVFSQRSLEQKSSPPMWGAMRVRRREQMAFALPLAATVNVACSGVIRRCFDLHLEIRSRSFAWAAITKDCRLAAL